MQWGLRAQRQVSTAVLIARPCWTGRADEVGKSFGKRK